jgi:hypothetical protein
MGQWERGRAFACLVRLLHRSASIKDLITATRLDIYPPMADTASWKLGWATYMLDPQTLDLRPFLQPKAIPASAEAPNLH